MLKVETNQYTNKRQENLCAILSCTQYYLASESWRASCFCLRSFRLGNPALLFFHVLQTPVLLPVVLWNTKYCRTVLVHGLYVFTLIRQHSNPNAYRSPWLRVGDVKAWSRHSCLLYKTYKFVYKRMIRHNKSACVAVSVTSRQQVGYNVLLQVRSP